MSLKFAVAGLLALAMTDVALAGEQRVANTSGIDAVTKGADSGAAMTQVRAPRTALHKVMSKRASSR
jgi:hypothetical protein